ncbi:CYFA0S05e02036g1_1 [Cyberlindnera fabianii]|uniref:CYFA0S05e02036g1_1 n=1 Tax=Cyberlindnera fabianii TaxID=36022 RepID=A0A061ASP2_CYBFA|nr:CYFA0S05e02036g1_1 [Cyberlindnera fabianii]
MVMSEKHAPPDIAQPGDKSPSAAVSLPLTDDDDDNKTLFEEHAQQLMYFRDEGILEGSTVVDGQDGGLKVPLAGSSSSHVRSLSNEMRLKTQVSQLHYNNNRVALDRSVSSAVQLLQELKKENGDRPVFYPTRELSNSLLNSRKAHLALIRKNSIQSVKSVQKQAEDDDDDQDELSKTDLKVLKLNVKMDNNAVSNLDKTALAKLLDDKISQVSKHLNALKERIDDTSSKVFVTGDLNSGKSTFCNALLRRKVLPEDQQPCTTVFCEVIDCRENNGAEEVHAVPIGSEYDIKNESTYKVFQIKELEHLVGECDKYAILKVYVADKRTVDSSLLRNGIVDIALIDAPGLNLDSYQTQEVFSRQEEIDLVVFVVSAENQFTLSAKEFISAAANEKKFIFIVVNRFDNIRDKNKCMRRILEQVQQLSPDTHKDAREFVHFVSSSGVVEKLPDFDGDDDNDGHGGGGGGGDGDGGAPDFDNIGANPDFDHLEASLRNFVLKKRALSKLQPAKTYLSNLFSDIEALSSVNQKMYLNDRDTMTAKLDELSPRFEESMLKSVKVNEKIESLIENTSHDVYNYTRDKILSTLNTSGDHPVVEYRGLFNLAEYVYETQQAITANILETVSDCEKYARKQTAVGVESINKLGRDTLGDEFNSEKVFRDDVMFTRRKDSVVRQIDDSVSLLDFIDPSLEGLLSSIGVNSKTSNQVLVWKNSLYSVGVYALSRAMSTGRVVKNVFQYGSFFSIRTLRLLAVPLAVGVGIVVVTYLVSDIPNALPRKLALKIKYQMKELDYPHQNSDRIAKEVRKVLKFPAREVQNSFQSSLDKHAVQREKILGSIKSADIASAFFGKLLKKAIDQRQLVNSLDLENTAHV